MTWYHPSHLSLLPRPTPSGVQTQLQWKVGSSPTACPPKKREKKVIRKFQHYRKSSIKPPTSNKPPPPPPLFMERKLISPPLLPSPKYSSLINDRPGWTDPGWFIYQLEVRIWFWSSAAKTLYVLCLSFSTLCSSSLWRTDTIVVSKLNKPTVSINPRFQWAWNK